MLKQTKKIIIGLFLGISLWLNKVATIFAKVIEGTGTEGGSSNNNDGQIVNPVLNRLGHDVEGALEGSLFINYSVLMWRTAISLGSLVVVSYYVIGAFEWLTSGGDSKGMEKARTRFTNATIGLFLIVTSFTLVGFIGELLFKDEFSLLEITFPTPN